jgi:cobalamin biosynthesis protein CobW
MQLNKIPATVVNGFIGSGKTTLLSSLLKHAQGQRIAVIMNEFGQQDIDSEVLRGCALDCDDQAGQTVEEGIYELANGCICCTVEEEFLPVMQALVARRDDIDHILIETSGLALPKPLVQAFKWPEIKQFCTVDAIITVVDGPAVAAGRYAHDVEAVAAQRAADENLDHDPSLQELLDDQLDAADLVLVTKQDLLSAAEQDRVQQWLSQRLPERVRSLLVNQADVADQPQWMQSLMGIGAHSEDHIDHIHNHHDAHHAHGAHHDHAHDHFDSCVITLGEVAPEALKATLEELMRAQTIYRVKGFAALPGKPMRQVVQGVGQRLETHFDRLWQSDEPRQTQLVFIGKHLDEAAIKAQLQALSSPQVTAN